MTKVIAMETEYVCLALVIMAIVILLLRSAIKSRSRNEEQVIDVLEHFITSFECGITVDGVEHKSAADFENQVVVEKGPAKHVKLIGLGKRDDDQHFIVDAWQVIGSRYEGYKPAGIILIEVSEIEAKQFITKYCSGSSMKMFQAAVS